MKIAYSVKGTEAMNLECYFVTDWSPSPAKDIKWLRHSEGALCMRKASVSCGSNASTHSNNSLSEHGKCEGSSY